MFRIVNDLVPAPGFLLICDNRHCANLFSKQITGESGQQLTQQELQRQQDDFIIAARQDGWLIGLDAQLCPGHFGRLREGMQRAAEGQKRVEIIDPLKFNGGKVRLT